MYPRESCAMVQTDCCERLFSERTGSRLNDRSTVSRPEFPPATPANAARRISFSMMNGSEHFPVHKRLCSAGTALLSIILKTCVRFINQDIKSPPFKKGDCQRDHWETQVKKKICLLTCCAVFGVFLSRFCLGGAINS